MEIRFTLNEQNENDRLIIDFLNNNYGIANSNMAKAALFQLSKGLILTEKSEVKELVNKLSNTTQVVSTPMVTSVPITNEISNNVIQETKTKTYEEIRKEELEEQLGDYSDLEDMVGEIDFGF